MRWIPAAYLLVLGLAAFPTRAGAQVHPVTHAPAVVPTIERGVVARPWRYIVVHHSGTAGGSVPAFDAYHRGVRHLPRGMAYHFVIGNGHGLADGTIAAGPRWTSQLPGAHVAAVLRDRDTGRPLDDVAIGICLVGNLDTAPETPRQRTALRGLVTALENTYGISPERVLGHDEVPGTHTACPGRHLAMAALRQRPPGGS